MNRYKVLRPFTDYGMHHSVGSIITDVSIISNFPVKLWEGLIVCIDDSGKEHPVEKPKPTVQEPVKPKATPSTPVATVKPATAAKTAATTKVVKTVTKVTK